jgi:hypothetical protein
MISSSQIAAMRGVSRRTLVHVFEWSRKTLERSDLRENVPDQAEPIKIGAFIWPADSDAIVQEFGIVLEQPHKMLAASESVAGMRVGDTGDFDGRRFKVVTPPRRMGGARMMGLVLVLLEEMI